MEIFSLFYHIKVWRPSSSNDRTLKKVFVSSTPRGLCMKLGTTGSVAFVI